MNIISQTPPFNPDKNKCCCLGTGWFDQGGPNEIVWISCPHHHSTSLPNPNENYEQYLAYLGEYCHQTNKLSG